MRGEQEENGKKIKIKLRKIVALKNLTNLQPHLESNAFNDCLKNAGHNQIVN